MKRGKEGMRKSSQNEQVPVKSKSTTNRYLRSVSSSLLFLIGTNVTPLMVQVSTTAPVCLPGDKNAAVSSHTFFRRNPFQANIISRGALLRVRKRRPLSSSLGSPRPGRTSMSPFIMSGWCRQGGRGNTFFLVV